MTDTLVTHIKLKQKEALLEVHFEDGASFSIPCAFLRVNSPSAEVQGHGAEKAIRNAAPEENKVNIISIEPVGNYAVKLIFDDGHQSGLYTWRGTWMMPAGTTHTCARTTVNATAIASRSISNPLRTSSEVTSLRI